MIHKPVNHKLQHSVALSCACIFPLLYSNSQAGISQSEIEEITANWKCQWCPYVEEPLIKGEVEAGAGAVSNDSYKHGNYTGLDAQGAYFVGNAGYEYKDNISQYMNLNVRDIGLESRKLDAKAGIQGKYDLRAQYSKLPSLTTDTARTPYQGDGYQKLPTGWVSGTTTSGMTELGNSLRDIDIYTERDTVDVGATYYATPSISYDLRFEQQTKQGRRSMGLALLTNSVILAVPVDTTTKQGEVKVSYRADRWQGSLGYGFSIFTNAHDRVRWENAYAAPASATEGQAALEPDNEMQRISLDGSYHYSPDTEAIFSISFGRMTQNEEFLTYTVNGTISPQPLPRSSLDGEVNTHNSTLRLNSRWNDDWSYSLQYRQNEQSNDTPRATYSYVFADFVVAATPRANFPYSFRKKELSLQGRYQITSQRHLKLDYVHVVDDRTYQEVEKSDEDILSAMYRSKVNEQLEWSLGLKAGARKGDYIPVPEITPPEHALLRKYNLANRKRNSVKAAISYSFSDALQLSAYGDYANDDYSDSDVGLHESRQSNYTLELQSRVREKLNINIDYSITNIESAQTGVTWNAENKDRMNVVHGNVSYELRKYQLLLGADVTFVNAVGDIAVSTGDKYPSLKSTRKTLKLFVDYSLNDQSSVHAFFGYEDYDEENWANEGVVPNTLDNVLTLGEVSPSYDIGMFAISYKTRF